MQMNDRSTTESLPEVLDRALARLKAGESVEACLNAYPQYARDLEPLLRTGDLLSAQADTQLPPEMDEWLATGAREFAALAAQMAPKAAKSARHSRGRPLAPAPSANSQFADILDETLLRVKRGESVDACVIEYPEHASALAPLLSLGNRMRASAATPLPADLEAWLPNGKHDFMALAEQLAPRYAGQRKRAAARKLTVQRAAVAVLVVAVMMGAVDTASAQSMPGDTLYTWKRAHENISLALTVDPNQRSQLFVEYAGRRLQEFHTLVTTGNDADAALIAETLDSLLENVQGALATSQQTQATDVAPVVKQILNEAKSAITQATVVAPDAVSVLDDARARADVIDQNIVTAGVANTPTDTASATEAVIDRGSSGDRDKTATPLPPNAVVSPLTPTAVPTSVPSLSASPAPTLAVGETSAPLPSPTVAAQNTPTIDPATALPPSPAPTDVPTDTPTEVPPQPSETPTIIPTQVPTDTVVPSATPISVTEQPTEQPPPTPPPTERPTRPPLETNTPVPTDTVTPTETLVPTDTETPVPTLTDTAVPTDTITPTDTVTPTDTPVPTITDTSVPTNTDTPVVILSASEQPATATSVGNQDNTSTPTPEAGGTPVAP